MPGYDASLFDPPAPVAYVTLRNPANGAAWVDVPMLLDSGADVSLVPKDSIERLGLTLLSDGQYELVSFGGYVSLAAPVSLELLFLGRVYRGQFLLADQEWGILGRNILNTATLVLNGPQLTWGITPSGQR